MSIFGLLSEIDIDTPSSWRNRAFLTFDIDWVHDEILLDSIKLLESSSVLAIWFVTHYTPVLTRIRADRAFEIGVVVNLTMAMLLYGISYPLSKIPRLLKSWNG